MSKTFHGLVTSSMINTHRPSLASETQSLPYNEQGKAAFSVVMPCIIRTMKLAYQL